MVLRTCIDCGTPCRGRRCARHEGELQRLSAACFLVKPSGAARVYLHRYCSSSKGSTCADGWHEAFVEMARGRIGYEEQSARRYWVLVGYERPDGSVVDGAKGDSWPHSDPRWPTSCAKCSYRFVQTDEWQLFWDSIYVDDNGGEHLLRDRTPGMMWDATWMGPWAQGADGRCLVVVCPNGREWMIDGRANNCTLPNDEAHRCWIRHGTPPNITVDKNVGATDASAKTTCAAGAGSIQAGDYHGFLQGGVLT